MCKWPVARCSDCPPTEAAEQNNEGRMLAGVSEGDDAHCCECDRYFIVGRGGDYDEHGEPWCDECWEGDDESASRTSGEEEEDSDDEWALEQARLNAGVDKGVTTQCDECGTFFTVGYDGDVDDESNKYCNECWEADDRNESEESTRFCDDCGCEETDTNYLHEWSDGGLYCEGCIKDYLAPAAVVSSSSVAEPARHDAASVAAGEKNRRNIAAIKAAFPNHCAHHLYFAFRRSTPSRGCAFGDSCRSGRHDKPAGLEAVKLEPW